MSTTISDIVKEQIDELTGYDIDSITDETPVSDFELASLDFLSIQVALKRALDIKVDLGLLAEANIQTYGELIDFLENNCSRGASDGD